MLTNIISVCLFVTLLRLNYSLIIANTKSKWDTVQQEKNTASECYKNKLLD